MTLRASTRAIRLGLPVIALLFAPLPGRAAPEPMESTPDLKGVRDATLGVSQLTPDGVQCGLDLTRIGHAAGQLVTNAGIALREDATTRMTVSTMTARVGADQCATAAMLGVYTRQSFFSSAAGWVQTGYVVVWQRSLMVTTPIGQHAAAVIGATRRLSEQMLADWRAQNRPAAHGATPDKQPMAMANQPAANAASPQTQSGGSRK